MADKEERIYISYYKNNPCENCGKDYCAEGTCFCDIEFARSIPVIKAIEVMAKGIHRYKKEGGLFVDGYAEAALNALLGVEK